MSPASQPEDDRQQVCPGCGGALLHGTHGPARSRYDEQTSICSPCGVWEALAPRVHGLPLTAPGRIGERTRIDEEVVPYTFNG